MIPKCFGDKDVIFGDHPNDDTQAREMLKAAIDQKATMNDIVATAELFMKSKGASANHISEEVQKIRNLDF
jgi:hypothetical protein